MNENVFLASDEKIIWEGKADMFYVSPNPIVKIMMFMFKIISAIFGIRKTGDLVLTTKKMIYSYNEINFWVLRVAGGKKIIFNQHISSLEYGFMATILIFFKTQVLKVNSTASGGEIQLALKNINEGELNEKIRELTILITK